MVTTTGSCRAVSVTLLITMTTVACVTRDTSSRQQATDSGLCRIYSFNIGRQPGASSWQPDLFDNEQLVSAAIDDDRQYFICCQDEGTETGCRDRTYQRPDNGNRGRAEEFCRGEVVLPGDVARHWIEDETELFVGDELIYCGGCCGQQLASNTCSERLKVTYNYSPEDGVCDPWIPCFIEQCRTNALEVLAGRTPKCSVPPPPYPKHFIHERRALPVNLSLALEAQIHHTMTSSSSSELVQMTSSVLISDAECSRRYCHGVQPADRCSTGCCRSRFCCDHQINAAVGEGSLQWPISADKLIAISVVFAVIAVVFGLALVIFPGTRRRHNRRRAASSLSLTSDSVSSSVTSSRVAAVGLGRASTPSGGSRKTSKTAAVDVSRRFRRTHESVGLVDNDDEERYSDTRILVVTVDDDDEEEEDQDIDVEDGVCDESRESDVDSV